MADDRPLVAVTFRLGRDQLAELFGDEVRAEAVVELPEEERARTLAAADALLVWDWRREFHPDEGPTLGTRFVQLLSAGADQLPFDQLPPKAVIASNVGAYAEPMAEHALAMSLALLKRLPEGHAKLAAGVWDQSTPSRWVRGAVCGILGFGGIGKATGRLMRALGVRVHAINTSRRTGGLIGARELGLMKPRAVLVNVARGRIVDQAALYEHLRAHPEFSAGIDAWWVEPFGSGEFRVEHPFFELPNLLGSPHNSALVPGILDEATRRAAANVLRFVRGEPVTGVVRAEDSL